MLSCLNEQMEESDCVVQDSYAHMLQILLKIYSMKKQECCDDDSGSWGKGVSKGKSSGSRGSSKGSGGGSWGGWNGKQDWAENDQLDEEDITTDFNAEQISEDEQIMREIAYYEQMAREEEE